jgi:hypothetical protein
MVLFTPITDKDNDEIIEFWNIYEYDKDGKIVYSELITRPYHEDNDKEVRNSFTNFLMWPLKEEDSEYRIIIKHDENNESYQNLRIDSIFEIDDSGNVLSLIFSAPEPEPEVEPDPDQEPEEEPFYKPGIDYDAEIFLHVTLTDGDGKKPIGIQNNGTDSLNVSATFRTGDEQTDPIIDVINQEWRVTIREPKSRIYDIVNIEFINGILNFHYTTTNKPANCIINEDDFEIVSLNEVRYKMTLIGDTNFKVYRDFKS